MRHNKKINHLGRTNTHRNAMLSNMACSLIKHKRIFTTVAKAKALRKFVEPLITKSKVSQKIGDRPGGYTRILKTGNRLGDNAAMCFIELVDYNENMLKTATAKKATKTRRSRKKSTAAAETEAPVAEAPVAEEKAAE